jgi:hypothetical protein
MPEQRGMFRMRHRGGSGARGLPLRQAPLDFAHDVVDLA